MVSSFVKVFGVVSLILLELHLAKAIWQCETDDDCSDLDGGVCLNNKCGCPVGTQAVNGGTQCAQVAPYHFSRCAEDFQCSRLFTGFQCHRDETSGEGSCRCSPDHHYFLGRCWLTRDYGETCTRDEECRSAVLNNPFSMQCLDGSCTCSEGYYLRQRGECRRIGHAIGDDCVLDVDCQFPNGVCDFRQRICYDSTVGVSEATLNSEAIEQSSTNRSDLASLTSFIACRDNDDCTSPFICSNLDVCTCPAGYFEGTNGRCLAEIGSPATEENCDGFFNIVEDGRCVCPANFFAERNMRDCVKAAIRFTDSCISDDMCHTFGVAGICGPPGQWQLRSCTCIEGEAVKETHTSMCRLFAAIGEICEVDDDCMAGNVVIECRPYEDGEKRCACPDGYEAVGNLCLLSGLVLGEQCQVSEECTGTENSACKDGVCACDVGFGQSGEYCLPVIGSVCAHDDDCIIGNTTCQSIGDQNTCQCKQDFVTEYDACWEVSSGFSASCEIDKQCHPSLGTGSFCKDGACTCAEDNHFNEDFCWPKTGLTQPCSTRSQCFLGDYTERVVCRNGFCECDFQFPFDERLNTCGSSASNIIGNPLLLLSAFVVYFLKKIN